MLHVRHKTSPIAMASAAWRHRRLIYQMAKREVIGRYRGSVMGIFWSLANPILMIAVYTFVFGFVFKARWAEGGTSQTEVARILFAGVLIFGLFSECFGRSPQLILANTNFVKKVIFPLEIFPYIACLSSLFHTAVSFLVWLGFSILTGSPPGPWALTFPLLLLPLLGLTLGLSWIFASLGVYLRDIVQITSVITSILMFLTPIFYPLSALPAAYQSVLAINPLCFIVEQGRAVLIWGNPPDWAGLAIHSLIAFGVAWLGFAWFQRTRKGFADVL